MTDWIALSIASLSAATQVVMWVRYLKDRRATEQSFREIKEAWPKPRPAVEIPPLVLKESPTPLMGPFNIPTFGAPKLATYRAEDFENPLRCGTCSRQLAEEESFYEIPLPEQPEGALLAVCLMCYGKSYVRETP